MCLALVGDPGLRALPGAAGHTVLPGFGGRAGPEGGRPGGNTGAHRGPGAHGATQGNHGNSKPPYTVQTHQETLYQAKRVCKMNKKRLLISGLWVTVGYEIIVHSLLFVLRLLQLRNLNSEILKIGKTFFFNTLYLDYTTMYANVKKTQLKGYNLPRCMNLLTLSVCCGPRFTCCS